MLVCARLRHVTGTQWSTKRYMNMDYLNHMEDDLQSDIIAGWIATTADTNKAENHQKNVQWIL